MIEIPKNPSLSHQLYENLVTAVYEVELNAGDTFIDLGANVGHHTWRMASAVGETGRGIAVEPVPDFADRVAGLLEDKSITWVEIVRSAVSDFNGETAFFVQPDHIGWSSMFAAHRHPADEPDTAQEISVPVGKLDDLVNIEPSERLGVIKIDIENAEFAALRGAERLLVDARPIVIFENNPRGAARHGGYEVSDFFDFFAAADYDILSLVLQPIRTAEEWRMCPSSYYLALPSELELGDLSERYGFQAVADRILGESNNGG